MARLVNVIMYGEVPWYTVDCERCGTHISRMSSAMWTREAAETHPCYVCEPRAVGCLTRDPDPQDAIDFDGPDDAALAAIDDNYAMDLATSRRKRAPRYSEVR